MCKFTIVALSNCELLQTGENGNGENVFWERRFWQRQKRAQKRAKSARHHLQKPQKTISPSVSCITAHKTAPRGLHSLFPLRADYLERIGSHNTFEAERTKAWLHNPFVSLSSTGRAPEQAPSTEHNTISSILASPHHRAPHRTIGILKNIRRSCFLSSQHSTILLPHIA